MLRILCLLPELLNVNGDSENARVLERRARWADIPVEVASTWEADPDLIVIGSGFDGDISAVTDGMRATESQLVQAVLRSVPVLAIGLGFEMLGTQITCADGTTVEGLGLIPGEAEPMAQRAVGDIVVQCPGGTLVGYENHGRAYAIDPRTPALGGVVVGVGNGGADRREGIAIGSVVGSHIHGPLLAQNPWLADRLLRTATGGRYSAANPQARWADSLAAASRAKVLIAHGLPAEVARRPAGATYPTREVQWLI